MSRELLIPNPENCFLDDLNVAADCAPSKGSHKRVMAMRALLIGIPRDQVAKLYDVTDRSILN
jgi:hypothetical protein